MFCTAVKHAKRLSKRMNSKQNSIDDSEDDEDDMVRFITKPSQPPLFRVSTVFFSRTHPSHRLWLIHFHPPHSLVEGRLLIAKLLFLLDNSSKTIRSVSLLIVETIRNVILRQYQNYYVQ